MQSGEWASHFFVSLTRNGRRIVLEMAEGVAHIPVLFLRMVESIASCSLVQTLKDIDKNVK